jgi:hypothetical protein
MRLVGFVQWQREVGGGFTVHRSGKGIVNFYGALTREGSCGG